MRLLLCFSLAIAAVAQEPARRKATVLKGARILTVSDGVIDGGVIVIDGRVIKAVGKDAAVPADANVIDCTGRVVIPGLIDACATLYVGEGSEPGSPEHDAYDAIDPFDEEWKEALEAGVTLVYVNPPNRGTANGLGALIRLNGSTDPARLLARRAAALKFTLGVGAGDVSSAQQRYQEYRSVRSMFEGAKAYREAWEKYRKDLAEYETKKKQWDEQQKKDPKPEPPKPEPPKPEPPKPEPPKPEPPKPEPAKPEPPKLTEEPKKPPKPATDRRNEALLRAMDEKNPIAVRIEAHHVDSIEHAVKLAEEFKLKVVIEQGTEAPLAAEALAKAKVPVVVGPVFRYGMKRVEYARHAVTCAAELAKAKVDFAVASCPTARAGHSGPGASRFLLEAAACAAAEGLTREQALRAVTLDAARIVGAERSHGSVQAGKLADLVVLSGDPFEPDTRVERVIVDGETLYARKSE